MSIFPWLNDYPGRPIKKRFAKAPRPVPYYGSPYQYINLPKPPDVPRLVWENVLKDFDQTLRLRYETVTAARLEGAEDEFMEQPGAVSIGVSIDPREYVGKSFWEVAWNDTAKKWLQSVISWSDLDTIVEQRHIWRPLTRGNGVGPSPLLKQITSGVDVYEGIDRKEYEALNIPLHFDPKNSTPYEDLANNIETWISYGKSRSSRIGRWNMVQMSWAGAVASDIELAAARIKSTTGKDILSDPAYADVKRFLDEYEESKKINTWAFGSGNPEGFKATASSPLFDPIKKDKTWSAAKPHLQAAGLNVSNDEIIFDFALKKDLSKSLGISISSLENLINTNQASLVSQMQNSAVVSKVAKALGPNVTDAEILALTPSGLGDVWNKGLFSKVSDFYKKKANLPGGMTFTLETEYIFASGVPLKVQMAAVAKHKEIKGFADMWTDDTKGGLNNLLDWAGRDPKLHSQLHALGVNPDLFSWHQILRFREQAFLAQDFLDAAFDDNSLFRTYIWLGKFARDLPDWMGNWGARLKYITPQFYIAGAVNYLDNNVLGVASIGKKMGLRMFNNAAFVPMRAGGGEILLHAKDFLSLDKVGNVKMSVWGVHNKVGNLVKDGSISAAERGNVLKDFGTSLDDLVKLNKITADEALQYRAFLNSTLYKDLVGKKLIDPNDLAGFYDKVKSKLVLVSDREVEGLYAGPMVRLGRMFDHAQNVVVDRLFKFKLPLIGNVLETYSKLFKTASVTFANTKFSKFFKDMGDRYIDMATGKIKGALLPKLIGKRLTTLLGTAIGSVGALTFAVIGWVASKLLSDIVNVLKGKPATATKEAVSKLVKIVLGLSLACLSPILLLLFIMLFIIGGILDQAGRVSQAVTIGGIFDRLAVEKTVTFDSAARSLNYVITITNRSSDDQLVTLVSDDIKTIPEDCSLGVIDPKNNASLGHIVYVDPPDGVVHRKSLKSGETIKIKYSLVGIPNTLTNATVINVASLEIPPKTGVGASDTGSVTNTYTFGKGGCVSNIGVDAIADVLSSCLVMVPKAPAPSHDLDTTSPYWPYDSYRKFDMACVTGTGLLSNPKCQAAFSTYYSAGSTYYPDWLQCTAFANIALGCFGGSDYYMSGNANTWLNEAMVYARHGMKFEAYNTGTGRPPLPGSVLVFSGGSFGHVGVVTSVSGAGGSYAVTLKNANLGSVEYHLLFDSNGNLKNPDALPGLTYLGFFKIK